MLSCVRPCRCCVMLSLSYAVTSKCDAQRVKKERTVTAHQKREVPRREVELELNRDLIGKR
jgi:hypothetical protein